MEGYKSTRYLLIFLNVIIFMAGGVCLGAGLMFKLDSGVLEDSVVTLFNDIQYSKIPLGIICNMLSFVMMGFGGTIMIVTVIGMCGSLKSSRACLWVFIALIVFFLMIEAALIGLWISVWGRRDQWLKGQMMSLLADYDGPEATDTISSGWNTLFTEARCCGVNAQFKDGGTNSDFTEIPTKWTSGTDKVPATCCQGVTSETVTDYVNSASCTNTPTNFYTEGCYDVYVRHINTYCIITLVTAGTCAVAGVMGIVAACIIIDRTKSRVEDMPHQTNGKLQPYVAIDYARKWRDSVRDHKRPPSYSKT